VTGDRRALSDAYVRGLDLAALAFDPEAMAARVAACPEGAPEYAWRLPMPSLARFRGEPLARAADEAEAQAEAHLEIGGAR